MGDNERSSVAGQRGLLRRSFTQSLAAASAVALLRSTPSTGQAAEPLEPLNRFPRMMQEFLIDRVSEAHDTSVSAKAKLVTRQDAEAFVAETRSKILSCFGPYPERTPLKARTTGRVERETYVIEKVIFESRPNFPVTANLYLPKVVGKVPGVVGTCGHSTNGKAAEAYQSFAQGLARLGYACLIYDPIGQGERLQYADENLKSRIGVGVREHIHSGNQQFLVGENLSMWRAWDGIRALDYLLTRPEVDPRHLGVTGNSGGGTMTTWLCGVEPRWTMAAPSCFVTTFLHNAENELPADTEQCPPGVLAKGLEHEDFLAAMAPNPIVILAKERDFFDVRGSEEAYTRLKRLYALLGKPENISLFVGPTEHGYSIENRTAMYAWFNRVTGASEAQEEPQIVLEKDETLRCTATGQVQELRPATVASYTADKAKQLAAKRERLSGSKLRSAIKQVLRLPEAMPSLPPHFRILRDIGNRGFANRYATTYAVETEPGITAICYLLGNQRHAARPWRQGNRASLYIAHRSSDSELRSTEVKESAWFKAAMDSGQPFFSCDVRGIGESLPNTCGLDSFDDAYGCDYFYAVHGIMLDRPYLGQKTWDVLRTIQWLTASGYQQVDLVGNGWGSIMATLASVLSDNVSSITLVNRPPEFQRIAEDEMYRMPLAYLPLNILESFDIPDCDAELGNRLRLL